MAKLLPRLTWLGVLSLLGLWAAGADTVFIHNVAVIPMTSDEVLANRDVLIRDGRFVSISPTGQSQTPKGAQVIEGSGKFLIPGLADMHVHFFGGSQVQPDMLYLYLANGVTTTMCMGGSRGVLRMRDKVLSGELTGPRIFSASPIIGNFEPCNIDAKRGKELVDQYAKQGFDYIKVYNYIPADAYYGIMDEAHKVGIPVVGHAVRSVGIQGAIDTGQNIAHLEEFLYGYFQDGLDESRIEPLAKEMKAHHISVVTTLIIYHNILRQLEDIDAMLKSPGVEYMPESIMRTFIPKNNDYLNRFTKKDLEKTFRPNMAFLQKLALAFQKEGVPLIAGTDSVMAIVCPGFALQGELQELVDAGLTPYQALAAATKNAAAFVSASDTFGTIEPGKSADAVLLRANPLDNISHTKEIDGVLYRGNWLSRQAIDTKLADIRTRAGLKTE